MRRRRFLKTTLAPTLPLNLDPNSESKLSDPPALSNAGIAGSNTFDFLNPLDRDCLAYRPDLLLLTVGTNDMNSRKPVPLPQFKANLTKLVERIKVTRTHVGLMTLLPTHVPYLLTRPPKEFYQPEGFTARMKKMNETIWSVARSHNLLLLDMPPIFEQVGNVGQDPDSLMQKEANSQRKAGVHPTPAGYRTMAVATYQTLAATAVSYQRIVCFGDSITRGNGGLARKSYPAYLKN